MRNGPLAVVCILIVTALCSCQHVPPQPLNIAVVRAELHQRLNSLDDVQEYAESLSSSPESEGNLFVPSDGLTLREGTVIALWYNGEARLAREEAKLARTRADLAGLLPDPELNATVGEKQVDVGNHVDKSLILGSGFEITIPVSGRRGAMRALRASEYELALLEAVEVEWAVAAQLNQAWLRWTASNESVALLERHLEELRLIVDLTRSLATAGELNALEARHFEIEHSRLTADLQQETGTLASNRLECLRIMGLHPNADLQLIPESRGMQDAPIPADLPDDHPTLAKFAALYQAAEDALHLEIRRQYPDITLSPGITDEEDETSIQLGLGIPLPVWNANRLGIAEAIARRNTVRIQFENALQLLSSDLAQEHLNTNAASKRWKHLTQDTMPMLESQAAQARVLLDTGELDMTLLNGLLNQSLALKRELVDARHQYQSALARVLAATEPQEYESVFEWENRK